MGGGGAVGDMKKKSRKVFSSSGRFSSFSDSPRDDTYSPITGIFPEPWDGKY